MRRIRVRLGTIFISLFAFVGMLETFANRGVSADSARSLYSKFIDEYPRQVSTFAWSHETKLTFDNALLYGFVPSAITMVIILIIINYGILHSSSHEFSQITRRSMVAENWSLVIGAVVFGTYFSIFLAGGSVLDPSILADWPDMAITVVVGGIIGYTVAYYLFLERKTKERRIFLNDKEIQLKEFEFEYNYFNDSLHRCIWTFAIGFTGFFIALSAGFFLNKEFFPVDIICTTEMAKAFASLGVLIITIIIAVFFGIIMQLETQLHDIIEATREFDKHISRFEIKN